MMYNIIYFLLFILVILTTESVVETSEVDLNDTSVINTCHKCHLQINNSRTNENSTYNYCTDKDVLQNVTTLLLKDNNEEFLVLVLEVPKTECKFDLALLVNSSIKTKEECKNHTFEEAADINERVHSVHNCIFTNCGQLNDNLKTYGVNVTLWYHYIVKGCYAFRFYLKDKNVIKEYGFINNTYKRTELTEPLMACSYDIHSNLNQSLEEVNVTLNVSYLANIKSFKVQLVKNRYKNYKREGICEWQETDILPVYKSPFMSENGKDKEIQENCMPQRINGTNMMTIQCNYPIKDKQTTGYCLVFKIMADIRCKKYNLSEQQINNNNIICEWVKQCTGTLGNTLHVENTNVVKSDKLVNTSSYLLILIVVIILIVLAIVGTLYIVRYLRARNEEANIFMNPQQDDFTNSACLKFTDFDITDNNEKRIDRENFTMHDDIVLLYTKSSASFMTLMKDFRGMLAKINSCSVHDWHDGAEWNNVARVGAVLWFTELLNNGCRVIWIDTPVTRSVIIENSKESNPNLNKLNKYHEIGDFRDMAFPVILELTKHNVKDLALQYRKHFVVRFEGLKASENMNDPFWDLSPHTRYIMPQHLTQLSLDLSILKPVLSEYEIKAEEDLLQQRLQFITTESIM